MTFYRPPTTADRKDASGFWRYEGKNLRSHGFVVVFGPLRVEYFGFRLKQQSPGAPVLPNFQQGIDLFLEFHLRRIRSAGEFVGGKMAIKKSSRDDKQTIFLKPHCV